MRYIVSSSLAAAAVLVLAVVPASASREGWRQTCSGASYVCGSSKASRTAEYAPTARRAKAARSAEGYRAERAYRSGKSYRSAKTSYRSRNVASNQPRTARRQRVATSYSGSGSRGMASYYWQGQRVASGGMFNPNAMTAAHKTLPFGTKVRVTNLGNGRSVTVTINDRGPFVKGRIIDLSRAAASSIGMTQQGVAPVSMEVLGRS